MQTQPTPSLLSRWRMLGAVSRSLVATLALSAAALVGIANHEAFRPVAYKDAVGVPTVGYGTTQGVKMGDKTTPERALIRLLADAQQFGAAIGKCVTVPLYQHEFDAYVSLAYNIGSTAFCNSNLVVQLNAGNYLAACQQILRWDKVGCRDKAGCRTLTGLTKRRQDEFKQCTNEAKP